MRKLSWLILTAAALATTGCVESMDSGYPTGSYGYDNYPNGYSSGYYSASSDPGNYYTRPTYVSNNTYVYNPPPRVVTQTRYVPVPVATPAPASPPQGRANHRNRPSSRGSEDAAVALRQERLARRQVRPRWSRGARGS